MIDTAIATVDCVNRENSPERLEFQGVPNFGMAETERAGFEPAVQFYSHAALAKRCFRPLSHLSQCRKPFLELHFAILSENSARLV